MNLADLAAKASVWGARRRAEQPPAPHPPLVEARPAPKAPPPPPAPAHAPPPVAAEQKRRLPVVDPKRAARWGPSFVVYRGPSAFNGQEVIGVVTGATGKSNNLKTGPMAQLWILAANEVPHEAQESGGDVSVCGDCTLRVPLNKGTGKVMCYVITVQGPDHVWYKAHERAVDIEGCLAVLKASGTVLRLGAYGDPAALPRAVVEALAGAASGITGYTHAWRRPDAAWLRRYAMASVEDEQGRVEAQAAGWRTFRLLPREDVPLDESEVMCVYKTHGTRCIDCGLCDGAQPDDKRRSVAIPWHGWQGRPLEMRKQLAEARGRSEAPPRAPSPEPRAPSPEPRAPSPEPRAPWKPTLPARPTATAKPVGLQVLPVTQVRAPTDTFLCERLRAKLTAASCVRRQEMAHSDGKMRTPGERWAARGAGEMYATCRNCMVGQRIEAQLERSR